MIGFRRARSRGEVQVSLGACYRLACQLAAAQVIADRKKGKGRNGR